MSFEELSYVAQIVASVGVIASFIFVALQIALMRELMVISYLLIVADRSLPAAASQRACSRKFSDCCVCQSNDPKE
jgi:hypothetical protein